jgi:DnaJ-class molecular chaperone
MMGLFENFKKRKASDPDCTVCNGKGRIKVKKEVLYPLDYIWVEERCQICEGKGYITS